MNKKSLLNMDKLNYTVNFQYLTCLLIIICLTFVFIPVSLADLQSETHPPPVQVDHSEIQSGFEICIVSPEMLENVRNNYGSQAIPLKVERGLFIGVLAPGVLYLRGDLNEDEFPLHEIVHENSKEKIGKHLIDITFGRDNAKTDLFTESLKYLIWLDVMYNQEDLKVLNEFIELLNDLSQSVRFEDEKIALPSYRPNYVPNPYTHYKISIVGEGFFKEKLDKRDSVREQILKDRKGRTVALVRKDQMILLNDLPKDERRYFLVKGLLFSMGFHGESSSPDSFFNPGNTCQINLSDLDKEAIRLMYGGRLQSGLDVDGIRKALGMGYKD